MAENVNVTKLNKRDKHHLKVFIFRIKNELEGYKYPFELLPLDQFDNFILDFVDMATGMSFLPLKTEKDFKKSYS